MKTKKTKLYKYWYGKFLPKQLIPKLSFHKNVQGWFFTQNYSFLWLRYCINYSVTVMSNTDENRSLAHEQNVSQYMNY